MPIKVWILLLKQDISSKEALSYAMLPFHSCIQIGRKTLFLESTVTVPQNISSRNSSWNPCIDLVAISTTWNSLVYTPCISNVCHCYHGMLITKTVIWLFCAIKSGSVTQVPAVEPNHHNYTFTASLSD